ncbi:GNAT family N-acetyltransferase [Robertmurraya sp. Marseille-Q9965]
MEILKYRESDCEAIVSLFYETIHSVNAKDYSQEQLDVWAPKDEKEAKMQSWKESLGRNVTFVAKINHQIVGFSDLTKSGYLDRLFVHKDYQGMGIATALVEKLESKAKKLNLNEIDTDASITARPFFENRGYKIVREQENERRGVILINYRMVKKLS